MEEYIARMSKSNSGDMRIRIYDNVQFRNVQTIGYHRYRGTRNTRSDRIIARESLSKTKKSIYELVDNNIDAFCSFITLTFKDDIDDYKTAVYYLKKYLKKVKYHLQKAGIEFKYVCIPEVQKHREKVTGKEIIHFHLLTNLETGSYFIPQRECKIVFNTEKKRWFHMDYYDLPFWDYGYSHAEPIREKNVRMIAGYISGYLNKGLSDAFFNQRKLMHSNNLQRNDVVYLKDDAELGEALYENQDYLVGQYIPTSKRINYHFIELEYSIPSSSPQINSMCIE